MLLIPIINVILAIILSKFQALQDGHTQFRASLDQAEDDIMMLRKLDRQIKSYNVSINP